MKLEGIIVKELAHKEKADQNFNRITQALK